MYRQLMQRATYSSRLLARPQIMRPQMMQANRMVQPMHQQMQQKRMYYKWLFGYDGIHDSLKRNPRSFWVRMAQQLWDLGVCLGLAWFVYRCADSDWERF